MQITSMLRIEYHLQKVDMGKNICHHTIQKKISEGKYVYVQK